jgi:hypothetical protein
MAEFDDSKRESTCLSFSELPEWWTYMRDTKVGLLILAGTMIFFATFLPRVLINFVLFTLGKFPFLRE